MLDKLKKIFGEDITYEKLKDKPKVALVLAKREMYRVEISGMAFVLVQVRAQEKFGVIALKKQKGLYEEQFQCNVAYCFEVISKSQRDSLIKSRVPFVSLPEQIYLPFLGVVLSNSFKKEKNINTKKMMPATQSLFLYLLYQKENYVLKSVAAEKLGLTRTTITRASEQLLEMGLLEQKKVGKEVRMSRKGSPREMWERAKPCLISPVQKKMVVRAKDIRKSVLNSGETALSYYTMLNVPKMRTVAIYKALISDDKIKEVDARWEDADEMFEIELWKYDPFLFAMGDKVDPVSLACSMADYEDERVEMALDEMMEELQW